MGIAALRLPTEEARSSAIVRCMGACSHPNCSRYPPHVTLYICEIPIHGIFSHETVIRLVAEAVKRGYVSRTNEFTLTRRLEDLPLAPQTSREDRMMRAGSPHLPYFLSLHFGIIPLPEGIEEAAFARSSSSGLGRIFVCGIPVGEIFSQEEAEKRLGELADQGFISSKHVPSVLRQILDAYPDQSFSSPAIKSQLRFCLPSL